MRYNFFSNIVFVSFLSLSLLAEQDSNVEVCTAQDSNAKVCTAQDSNVEVCTAQDSNAKVFTANGLNLVKVEKDSDFGRWLNEMHQKYPDVGLDKVTFVHVNAKNSTEEFWYSNEWELVRDSSMVICPKDFFPGSSCLHEWNMLHEIGLLDNYSNNFLFKVYHSDATSYVLLATIAGTTMYLYKKIKDTNWSILAKIGAVVGFLSIQLVGVNHLMNWIKGLDEKYADNFANQHGDKDALLWKLEHFRRLSLAEYSCRYKASDRGLEIKREIRKRFDPNFFA